MVFLAPFKRARFGPIRFDLIPLSKHIAILHRTFRGIFANAQVA